MKKKIFHMFVLALLCCIQTKAQHEILPFGQSTQQPWTASYFYASNGEKPADNWYAVDFDDSAWGTIDGPISTGNGIAYYVTPWASNYATYWVRRHFSFSDNKETPFVYMNIRYNDECEIYLNGILIYSNNNYYSNLVTVTMTEEMRSLFVEGDNVIAVKVSDTRGGQAFMDFGIEANNNPLLTNPNFDNGTNGWSWSGEGWTYGGQSYNYLARYITKNPFDMHQTIKESTKGLFRIRVQAFEAFSNNWNAGWEQYNNTSVYSYLYAGDTQHKVKNVFDEALNTNIWSEGFYKTDDDTYVPTTLASVSMAFQNEMYENEFYAYIDTTAFDFGIAQTETLDMDRWICFDNFRIEYLGENALAQLINEMENISTLPMESIFKSNLTLLLANINAANNYEEKGRILATLSDDFINAKKSSLQYALIKEATDALQSRLDTGTNMSEAAVSEARGIITTTNNRLSEGKINTSETQELLAELNYLNRRLNYTYLNITVDVPGAMGDSILSKVENFADVTSLKISGSLNNDDISTIQNRLKQLREIDMTDINMTTLPNRLFYQHSLLENVKLPAHLTTIGEYAFYQCNGIKKIDFPATLTTIKQYAFAICENLKEIILPEGIETVENDAFIACENNLYIKLPSSLKTLNYAVFEGNLRLKTVDFAEGLTHINGHAFYNCNKLNNLRFPSTLYYIGNNAFAYNYSLSNIEFNEGLFQIDAGAFHECKAITEVSLPSSLVLADSPFDYCYNLEKVTCLSIEPPYMTTQIPYGLSMEGRELYVPALSLNVYKQTSGWDKFPTIKPIDYLPENINIHSNMKLTLPESLPSDYKPNVNLAYRQDNPFYYGCLTVNGLGTLSLSSFTMNWSHNNQFVFPDRNINYNSLINNSYMRSDEVTILLCTRNNIWSFISLPFDVKISDITNYYDGTTNWVIRKYDGQKRASGKVSETWVKMSGDDIMHAGEGYIIQGSRYINNDWQYYSGFCMTAINNANKNNIFRTTDATLTLNEYESEFAHNRSWNLIGNPYPCYYDTRFMDFEAPITVWNMLNSTYTAYSPVDDSYILCPGEAFFVQCPINKGHIVFNEDGRQTNRDVRTIGASSRTIINRVRTTDVPRTIVNLSLSDRNNTDRTRIVLNEEATLLYEMDKDASKFMSTDIAVPQIYSSENGVNYAINERPIANGSVNLSTYFGAEGLYSITLANEFNGYQVFLEDKTENKSVVLETDNGYVFSTNAGTYNNRFILHFISETTDIEDMHSNQPNDTFIYSVEGIKTATPTKKGIYIQNGKKIMYNK